MVAHHGYTAQRPEDLEFNEGDTLDILSEGSFLVLPEVLHWAASGVCLQGGDGDKLGNKRLPDS